MNHVGNENSQLARECRQYITIPPRQEHESHEANATVSGLVERRLYVTFVS